MGSLTKSGAVLGMALLAAGGIAFSAARDRAPVAIDASSHREAPAISNDPQADNTDFYMWVAPDAPDTVTFVVNVAPLEAPYAGPNFYRFGDDVQYVIHIDNNGDAKSDIDFEFRFRTEVRNQETFLYNTGPITALDSPNLNVRQFFSVDRVDLTGGGRRSIMRDAPVPPNNVGLKSIPDYEPLTTAAVQSLPGGWKFFAGQRDDPFFADLGVIFDLLTIRPGPPGNMGGGADALANYNVLSIVMQAPKSDIVATNTPIIGSWTTTSRMIAPLSQTIEPQWTQVSRLGQPLVNEVVLPLKLKDAFNSIDPTKDAVALPYVTDPIVAGLLNALYGVPVPPAPRNDLVTIFLTGIPMLNQPPNVVASEMLRLNTSIAPNPTPNRIGVIAGDNAGFPNGRRLTDDVIDIALRVMAGATPFTPQFNVAPNNALGDGVDSNDRPFRAAFPYLANPAPGSEYAGTTRVPSMSAPR